MKFITNIHKISLPIRSRQIVKKIIKKNITEKKHFIEDHFIFSKKKYATNPTEKTAFSEPQSLPNRIIPSIVSSMINW